MPYIKVRPRCINSSVFAPAVTTPIVTFLVFRPTNPKRHLCAFSHRLVIADRRSRDDASDMFLEALNRNRAKRGAIASVVELPTEASSAASAAPPPSPTLTQSRSGGSSGSAGGSSGTGGSAEQTGRLQSCMSNASGGAARTPWRRPRSLLRLPGSAAARRQRTTIEVLPDGRGGGRTISPPAQGDRVPASSVRPNTRQYGRPPEDSPRLPSRAPLLLTDGVEVVGADDNTVATGDGGRRPSRAVPRVINLAGASPPSSPESTNPVIRFVDEGMREIEGRRRAREARERAREADRRARGEGGVSDDEFDMDSPGPLLTTEQMIGGQSLSPVVQDLSKSKHINVPLVVLLLRAV